MTKTHPSDLIYIDLCLYLHGKMLLKEVCYKHGISQAKASYLADKIVNYTPQIKSGGDIYKTSKMTVEEYMAWQRIVNKSVEKKSLVEEEIEKPMYSNTRRRVMEFINLQPA